MSALRLSRAAALLALAALLASATATAATLRLPDGQAALRSAAARAQFARDLAREIGGVLERVGAPDAVESRTVLGELAAIERLRDRAAVQMRARRLFDDPSFQQLRLVNTLGAVRAALDCAATPYGATSREMACWSVAAAYLAEREIYEDALSVLVPSGRLGYGAGMTRAAWLAQPRLWSRYAAAIRDHITLPHLMRTLE